MMTARVILSLVLTIWIWSGTSGLYGQSIDTLFTCDAIFSDQGGINANYFPNTDQILTICPDTASDRYTRIDFYSIALDSGDVLSVFDGADTTANLIDQLTIRQNGTNPVFQASVNNFSRCLTFRFQSDFTMQAEGWEAKVSCIDTCQQIIARIDSVAPNTNGGFVNICPGEKVFFFGDALYPEDSTFYAHSNENSTFRWDFGDGAFAFGQNVSHQFNEPGGYTVRLSVTDPFSCSNTEVEEIKVRVASAPVFEVNLDDFDPVCLADTFILNSGLNDSTGTKSINVRPGQANFSSQNYQTINASIPDGDPDPMVNTIILSDFSPGQRLTNIDDLERICVNLEHSRAEDLEIRIICPSGQEALLHSSSGFTTDPTLLGFPVFGDEGRVRPGDGLEYCWGNGQGLGTINETISREAPLRLPEGTYLPEASLNNLQGCPLNGEWQLTVRDTQVTSNGYVFNWSLDFSDDLFPNLESFSTNLAQQEFVFDATTILYDFDSIVALGEEPGLKYFQLEVLDNFLCKYDTSVAIGILPETSPLCTDCTTRFSPLPDTFVCRGDSIEINIPSTIPTTTRLTFKADPKYTIGFANHPPSNPYASPLFVSDVAQDTLTNPIAQIESICINITSDFDEDLAIFLRAPDGKILELSTNNGGTFDNYINTCFAPIASTPITIGAPPFSGTFAPEGNWSDLQGAPVNGVWELLVSDAFDPINFGEVLDWEITFISENVLDIDWSPAAGLSCTDCPNPRVSPTQSTNYSFSFVDSYGCSFSDEFRVTVLDTFAAPEIICGPFSPGNMIFNWDPVEPGLNYEGIVTINGVDSLIDTPIPDTFLIVGGLVFGDEVTLKLNVVPPDTLYPCFVGVGESTCVFEDCFTFTRFKHFKQIDCFGDSTGEVSVEALRGFRPFTYYLNGDFVGQNDSIFTGLPAGDYFLVTEDMTGCSDTLNFSLTESPQILTQISQVDSIFCHGEHTGSLTAMAEGGVGLLDLSWNYPATDPSVLSELPAGNYVLSVQDSLNCLVQDSILIEQPDSIDIQTTITPILCAGDANGGITVSLSGGTGELNFEWSNAIEDTMLINLAEGLYTISVTDANACQKVLPIDLVSPTPLVFDTIISSSVRCFGETNGAAEVFVSGGTGAYTYLWLDSLNQNTSQATNLPGGMIEVRITDEQSCLLTTLVEVPEPGLLQIDFDVNNVACLGGSDAEVKALVNGGTRPFQYNWQNGDQDSTLNNLIAGSYNITVTDVNGCSTSNVVNVTEPTTELLLTVEQSVQGCFGVSENEAIARPSGGGSSSYTYEWSDGQSSAIATELDSLLYTVTVTDAFGCSIEEELLLRDLPEMVPNMIIGSPTCFGDADGQIGINFIDGRPNADLDTYQFLWNTGQQGATIDNLLGDSLYTVSVTDPQGCMAVQSRFVRQPKLITFQIIKTDASCFGVGDGSLEVVNVSAESQMYTYTWDERTGNQQTPLASNLTAGVYKVTISDEFGCNNVGQAVVGQPERIEIDLKKKDNTCFGDLTGSVEASARGGLPAYRYSWSNGNTGPLLERISSGTYTITVTDQNNCFQSKSIDVNQPASLDVQVESIDVSCFGEEDGSISLITNGGAPPYEYRLESGDFNGSPILVGLSGGRYNITIRDANNCSFVQEVEVLEPNALEVDAGPAEHRILLGDSLQLIASAINNQGPVTFEWVEPFPDALPCLLCDSVTVQPGFTVSYEVIGIDSMGCQANDFVKIFVEKDQIIDVPTGFSPNQDGQNDQLILHGETNTLIKIFRVYDRMGALLYEVENLDINDPTIGWDGRFNGQDMPQDTYIWYLEALFENQITKVFRGQTTLIR